MRNTKLAKNFCKGKNSLFFSPTPSVLSFTKIVYEYFKIFFLKAKESIVNNMDTVQKSVYIRLKKDHEFMRGLFFTIQLNF